MEAELNKRERVCCLIIAELSVFLLLLPVIAVLTNKMQVHVSQTTLWCAICLRGLCCFAKAFLIRCQSIPSTQIFHLRGLCCFAYYLYWLKKSFVLHTIALREPCCFMCIVCWSFYWMFWCFFWDIGAFWVDEGNVVYAASHVFETLNPCSICLFTVHNSLSKMLIWFLFIRLHWRRNWKGRKRRHPVVHFIFVHSFK